jgi:aarF domain-containing kinase
MFPDALCRELSTLHADAPAHDFEHSRTQIESSLGLAPNTLQHVFDHFEETPLASGSIAQVHRAQLDGNLLAVKVRHPNVAQLITMDFQLMSLAARLCDVIPGLRWLRLRDSIAQFSTTLAAQAHLHVEAYHLEILNYNFRKFPSIHFPEPFFASSSVIIETFESGVVFGKVLEDLQNEADQLNESKDLVSASSPHVKEEPDEHYRNTTQSDNDSDRVTVADICPFPVSKFILTTGLNLHLKQLLVDNLMHADLHPGNIIYKLQQDKGLATKSSNTRALAMIKNLNDCRTQSSGQMSITLVDAGMVAQLNDHESATFIGLLSSIGEGNGYEAAYFVLQFSLENQRMTQEQESAFTKDMGELFAERCRGYGTNVDVGDVLRGVLGLVRKHQLRIDANFATLVVNILCLESMARTCLPDYNLLDAARPLLKTYRSLCYNADGTPKDPKFRRSKWVKFLLSLNYIKKMFLDKRLFDKAWRKQQKRIKQLQLSR